MRPLSISSALTIELEVWELLPVLTGQDDLGVGQPAKEKHYQWPSEAFISLDIFNWNGLYKVLVWVRNHTYFIGCINKNDSGRKGERGKRNK